MKVQALLSTHNYLLGTIWRVHCSNSRESVWEWVGKSWPLTSITIGIPRSHSRSISAFIRARLCQWEDISNTLHWHNVFDLTFGWMAWNISHSWRDTGQPSSRFPSSALVRLSDPLEWLILQDLAVKMVVPISTNVSRPLLFIIPSSCGTFATSSITLWWPSTEFSSTY